MEIQLPVFTYSKESTAIAGIGSRLVSGNPEESDLATAGNNLETCKSSTQPPTPPCHGACSALFFYGPMLPKHQINNRRGSVTCPQSGAVTFGN